MVNPETTLTRKIRSALEDRGALTIKVSGGIENAGTPDLIVVAERAVFLEVKTPSGRVSKLQRRYIARFREAGGTAEVIRSVADAERVVFGHAQE